MSVAGKILFTVMAVVATWLIHTSLLRALSSMFAKLSAPDEIQVLLSRAVSVLAVMIGGLVVLQLWGVDLTAAVAGLGLTGFALGFALRDALSNLLAGVLILMYRPFWIGDRLCVTGLEGTITALDLRYTTLKDEEQGRIILIPNAHLFNNPVIVKKAQAKQSSPTSESQKTN